MLTTSQEVDLPRECLDISNVHKSSLLIQAIVSGSEIDVCMVLEEISITDNVDESIMKLKDAVLDSRDTTGRNALHIAALIGSPVVVKHLLNSYDRLNHRKLQSEVAVIEAERSQTIAEIFLTTTTTTTTMTSLNKPVLKNALAALATRSPDGSVTRV